MDIIIGSKKELPEIISNNDEFNIMRLTGESLVDIYQQVLKSNYYYKPYSFMGCTCGFCYGDWSKNDPDEEHAMRIKDVENLMHYLRNSLDNNEIKIIVFDYDNYPDNFDSKKFNINNINENEFDWDENVILSVVAE